MISNRIKIKMKSGREIEVDACGSLWCGEVDTLECYWPESNETKRRRPIPHDLYDVEDAAKKYYDAVIEEYEDRYRFQMAETMMLEGII